MSSLSCEGQLPGRHFCLSKEVEAKDKYSLGFQWSPLSESGDKLRLQLKGVMKPGTLERAGVKLHS